MFPQADKRKCHSYHMSNTSSKFDDTYCSKFCMENNSCFHKQIRNVTATTCLIPQARFMIHIVRNSVWKNNLYFHKQIARTNNTATICPTPQAKFMMHTVHHSSWSARNLSSHQNVHAWNLTTSIPDVDATSNITLFCIWQTRLYGGNIPCAWNGWQMVGNWLGNQHCISNLMPTLGQCWKSDHKLTFSQNGWQRIG